MRVVAGLILILASALLASAQEFVLMKGQTRDSSLAIVPFANVLAVDTATNEMESFAVTGVDGNFQLRLKKGKVYQLKVTYIGFVPFSQYIQLEENVMEPMVIVLRESVNKLDEVTVVAEMPVLVQGDTISYKAEAFTDGDERKLEDVLEDLPGFDVDENGEIQVQGKRVEKVLVDGKEFFEGDTKLATKNIPADVVDRIQVLQNYNDIAPLSGVIDSDRLALNIELKEDKKRIVFGDLEAGGGPSDRYFGHANTFYYAPKTSVNFIGDANNAGLLALSINDYFRMTGGLGSLSSRNGTTFRINAENADIPVTDRNSAQSLTNRLGALNFSTEFSKKFLISGFAIGFDNSSELGSNSLRTYPQLDVTTEERLISTSTIENTSGLARFSAKYTPNYNMQLDYNFFAKRGNIIQNQNRDSQLNSSSNLLSEDIDRSPVNQTHQLRLFTGIDEKNILSAELKYSVDRQDTQRGLVSGTPLFSSFLPVNTNDLSQDLIINSNQFDAIFSYYYLLNKTTHLNGEIGVNNSNQELISDLNSPGASIQNLNNDLTISNQYASFSFRKKWENLTINPELSLNNYRLSNGAEPTTEAQFVFPRITANYDFGSSHSLRASYQQSVEYGDVAVYTEGLLLDGYNTLLNGNSQLQPAVTNTFNITYRNFNSYNFFNIYAGLNVQTIKDALTQNQQLNGIENSFSSINSSGPNQISSLYATLEKRFNHWRLSGNATLSRSELNNRFENNDIVNETFSQVYRLNFSAKLFKVWSLRSGYTVSINNYTSAGLKNTFLNFQPNVGTTLVLKNFRIESSYTYNSYKNRQQNQQSSFDVLDASISYRKGKSPWEFKVQGMNLLDTRAVRRDSFSNNLISTFSYFVQQRYGLFTVKYDL